MEQQMLVLDAKRSVLIVDDHVLLRQGLIALLTQDGGYRVCGDVGSAELAMASIDTLLPEIVLLDISLPGMNGIEFVKNIKAVHPNLPVVVLSMHDEVLYAERALRAGAMAYVMKSAGAEVLLTALSKALSGEFFVSGKVGNSMFQKFLGHSHEKLDSPVATLSDRELEIFELIGRGRGTREIANALHISVKTVDSHRAHLKEKLLLGKGNELVRHAVRFVEGTLWRAGEN